MEHLVEAEPAGGGVGPLEGVDDRARAAEKTPATIRVRRATPPVCRKPGR